MGKGPKVCEISRLMFMFVIQAELETRSAKPSSNVVSLQVT